MKIEVKKSKLIDIKSFYLSAFFLLGILFTHGQRIIKGKVIDEDMAPAAFTVITANDTAILARADSYGNFEINVPKGTNTFSFGRTGCERAKVVIIENCDYLEVILLLAADYDFISSGKIDQLRKRKFDKLPELYKTAYQKGIFKTEKPCFTQAFIPAKPSLDRVSKWVKAIKKQNKNNFEKLIIGDTIKIPFSGNYGDDGTNRTSLIPHSYLTDLNDEKKYDCIIEGIIINKSENRNSYLLKYKVTKTDKCKYKSITYNNKEIIVGDIREINMRILKVLIE